MIKQLFSIEHRIFLNKTLQLSCIQSFYCAPAHISHKVEATMQACLQFGPASKKLSSTLRQKRFQKAQGAPHKGCAFLLNQGKPHGGNDMNNQGNSCGNERPLRAARPYRNGRSTSRYRQMSISAIFLTFPAHKTQEVQL